MNSRKVLPNNSFKPRPLRGLGVVLQLSHRRGRKSVRLYSGVRPQNQRSGHKSSSRNFLTTGGPPTLEQPRPVSGIAKTRYASAVGCGFTRVKALSAPGLPGQKSIAFSGLTIRSSRDRFAASAWRRRLCHRRGRKSVRLNSGVRPQKTSSRAKSS